jgi:FlaA1/EpsC-like NDP-sugar epimerase
MRRRYFQTGTSKIIFLLDVLSVIASLLLALAIRSQFQYYMLTPSAAIALFLLTVLLRVLAMFLFDAYSLSFRILTSSDMLRIIQINLIPSVLVLLFRLISPSPTLRMPYSMIIFEYISTTLCFVLIRTALHNRLVKGDRTVGYKRRILLWAETADIAEQLPHLDDFCRVQRLEIRGILNANPLFWQTEYEGIRVFGDESSIRDILFSDDRISTLCFLAPEELTLNRLASIAALARDFNLETAFIRDRSLMVVSPVELASLVSGGKPEGRAVHGVAE